MMRSGPGRRKRIPKRTGPVERPGPSAAADLHGSPKQGEQEWALDGVKSLCKAMPPPVGAVVVLVVASNKGGPHRFRPGDRGLVEQGRG
jgi:hypothetical protein